MIQPAFKAKDRNALQRVLEVLEHNDISVVFKSNIHQKFAIMDQKEIVIDYIWFGEFRCAGIALILGNNKMK